MSAEQYLMYIGGERLPAKSGSFFESIDPTTGEVWALVPDAASADVEAAIVAARQAFHGSAWASLNGYRRGQLMYRLAEVLEQRAEMLAGIETHDNGKLFRETTGQVQFAARTFRYFAGIADKILGQVIPLDDDRILDFAVREPVGVCVALLGWNSPLQFTANKLAPALAAGNTVVVKPSEFAAASVLEFAKLTEEVGFPPGVINVVTGNGPEVGRLLSSHPDVDLISLTGSVATGRAVAGVAAQNITRVVLELGGKSPHIIFEDADFERALVGVQAGIFAAAGQTCIAGSRLLLQSSIYESFLERLVDETRKIRIGSPFDPATQMGPLANRPQYERVLEFIKKGVADGVRLVCGGTAAQVNGFSKGLFIQPTIFADATNATAIAREEAFGPVLTVIPFEDEAEAIEIANDSEFGLASGLWTKDLSRGIRVSRAMRTGTVWVNTYRTVAAAAPFGGFRRSGLGRERGLEAIREYTLVKNVMIDTSDQERNPFIQRS